MIPRLGDGNHTQYDNYDYDVNHSLENDSPSRGRKRKAAENGKRVLGLENDSPSRGRKHKGEEDNG